MDMLIRSELTNSIINHLREINSMGINEELIQAIERLFDGEDNLYEGAKALAMEHSD